MSEVDKDKMEESKYREWDINVKLAGVIGACIAALIGLVQFNDAREKEFRKPLYEERLATFKSVCKCTGILATQEKGDPEWAEARREFWYLYYGPLCLVEDQGVERATALFGEEFLSSLRTDELNAPKLQKLALNLAGECKRSLGSTWSTPLATLQNKYRFINESK